MSIASAGYSITMRLYHNPDDETAVGRVTTAIGEAGGIVSAYDFVDAEGDRATIDVTANARDVAHADEISAAVDLVDGVTVHKVSDRTFLMHLGGKLEVHSKVQLRTRDQLSMAYTPGVARVSRAIADRPEDARNLTIKGNTVAIVTDGSAVLGLGNIGPLAAMPVMEGKAALFKRFADIDAWPICLDTQDADEIVRTVEVISPGFGGVNLEDIAAPRCFEIEERLRERLDIPVFHDDQHGTAIVVLAALTNALKLVGKRFRDVTVAMAGAGAAGVAVAKLLMEEDIGNVVAADSRGIIHKGRDLKDTSKQWLAENTNKDGRSGDLVESLDGADVFIGVSAANLFPPEELQRMTSSPIVFALANPDPEVDARGARDYAAVVATGRSDYPNQINNVLAFPGVFRGALDARAPKITQAMNVAAARAIASVVAVDQLSATYVIPSIFNEKVTVEVAKAVRAAAVDG
ncbi:MAG: NAD-dependent malic enzyme [Acidimicrobiia bacterium]|nr:NAD-dependent malic enzyme [Acidimicrobiia bacterium]